MRNRNRNLPVRRSRKRPCLWVFCLLLTTAFPTTARELCHRKALINYYSATLRQEEDSAVIRLMIRLSKPALRNGEQIHAELQLQGENGELHDIGSIDYAAGKKAIRKQDREYERRHRSRSTITGKYGRGKEIDFTYTFKTIWQDWYPTALVLIEEQVEKGNTRCLLPLRTQEPTINPL